MYQSSQNILNYEETKLAPSLKVDFVIISGILSDQDSRTTKYGSGDQRSLEFYLWTSSFY